jgi:serine protease Do
MKQPQGALVAQVLPESPAKGSDLRPGDVILKFNGKDVLTSSALPPLVGMTSVGDTARLEVLRKGETLVVEVQIGELPDDEQLAGGTVEPDAEPANRLGLVVHDLTGDQREQLGIEQGGVLVESVAAGPAERAGLQAGDVILLLDGQPVDDLAGFNRILEGIEPERSFAVLVQRGDGRMFYPIRMPKP